jgi:hypothetical protein
MQPSETPIDQSELLKEIETLFAQADPQNLRDTERRLERLVRQLKDPQDRKRYEAAIDHLPDMVKHLG